MTELQLFKFIQESGCEKSFDGKTASITVDFVWLEDFTKLLDHSDLYEVEPPCKLHNDAIAIDITDLCTNYEIDMHAVFGGAE